MEVYDRFKQDGLTCPDPTGFSCWFLPEGGWKLYATYDYNDRGEVLVASGGPDFEESQLTPFVIEGPPTTAPSMAPTLVPTIAPTQDMDQAASIIPVDMAKTARADPEPKQGNDNQAVPPLELSSNLEEESTSAATRTTMIGLVATMLVALPLPFP